VRCKRAVCDGGGGRVLLLSKQVRNEQRAIFIRTGVIVGAIAAMLQPLSHRRRTRRADRTRPAADAAAMEGLFKDVQWRAALAILGQPDVENRKARQTR